MRTVVAKFGGSSLATAAQFKKVKDIVQADPARRFIVASAPGKRCDDDIKVTDLLYQCYDEAAAGRDYEPTLRQIRQRYADIAGELGIDFPLDGEMDIIRRHLDDAPARDYMASRGEYLNARLLAAYLGFHFIDAANCVVFYRGGVLDKYATYVSVAAILDGLDNAVIPGFYGADRLGVIRTFSRGGSDITGAIVARGVKAALYENWTDVSGMLTADPRIVPDPLPIDRITYRELRELSYTGATVLHEDAVFPCRNAAIPINIRNTNRPQDPGTMIVSDVPDADDGRPLTGVAGIRGYSSILIEKTMMNSEIGFGRRVLHVLENNGLSFEYMPSGVDTMSIILETAQLDTCREKVLEGIRKATEPDTLVVEDGLAIIAVVGHGIVGLKGSAARIFSAIAKADISIRMLDQGSSEFNIIVGVHEEDYEATIRAIYNEFFFDARAAMGK